MAVVMAMVDPAKIARRCEAEEGRRDFAESAFLCSVMMGWRFGPQRASFRTVIGITEPFGLIAAIAFLPADSSSGQEEAQALYERVRMTVRSCTTGLIGPLLTGWALVLLPLRDVAMADESAESLCRVLIAAHGGDFEKGYLRIGFGRARPVADVDASWPEAVSDLLGSRSTRTDMEGEKPPFEHDEAFLDDLRHGSIEHARWSIERLLEAVRGLPRLLSHDRYRIISLLGAACRMLTRMGLLECEEAFAWMDLEDLRTAEHGPIFEMAVRARFARLVDCMGRDRRRSPLVLRAIACIRENFSRQTSLESMAHTLGISPSHLSRRFHEETGKGFSKYVSDYRMEKAMELLRAPGATIKSVSLSCGYSDPNYFSRLFKKTTGMTPRSFSRRSLALKEEGA